MKKNKGKYISFIFIALLAFLISCSSSKTVAKLDLTDVKNLIDSSHFDFIAERVTPLRGRTRYLTSRYDVAVKKDTVVSFLPYFGRAYQAPMDPSKGGIQFTSTNFSYDVTSQGENEWMVIIKPKDYSDIQQLTFFIFGNGRSTLSVTSTHRDQISFSGYIQRIKE